MIRKLIYPAAVVLGLALVPANAVAQVAKDVRLHVNPRWKECSFQLDPSLTQAAWHRFTDELGLVTYFRPLRDAKPMGAGKFEVSALQWQTGIDDRSSAWNDTFVHPDSTHWLIEGSRLELPGLTVRVGVTSKVDVGAYVTKNPKANYGVYGGQLQYNLVNDATRNWAASTRVSFVSLYGPEDLDFTAFGLDGVVSREYRVRADWLSVSPYVGVSSHLSRSHEKSAVVSLANEQVLGAQAMLGISAQVSHINLAMEYSTARVQSRSIKVGVSF
jgi:hypothetical protein